MAQEPLLIKRYPNRRFYARHASKYVTLDEIAQFVDEGNHVEIRDSQSGEDLTRSVLTQIIVERYPEKMSLFPPAMLHLILQANDVMVDFLRGYFRNALGYLEYLQQASTPAPLSSPFPWGPAWWPAGGEPSKSAGPEGEPADQEAEILAQRIRELEEKVQRLEEAETSGELSEG